MADSLAIRAHHALCLYFFSGHGYDQTFTENMTHVQNALEHDPMVSLKVGCDNICACCPNLDSECPNAMRYDQTVLELTRIDHPMPWSELRGVLEEKILRTGRLEHICGDCDWYALCQEKLEG